MTTPSGHLDPDGIQSMMQKQSKSSPHDSDAGDVVSKRPRVLDLFDEAKRHGRPLHISAPMVRYSKLPFRLLIREYGVDVTYTPMILAHEFVRSQFARDSDFTTCSEERMPSSDGRQHALIAQFASSDPTEFARAAELIAEWVDGVDLNCGCPQSWAMKEGIGCSLMSSPDDVAAMVRAAKARLDPEKTVSCKIRISKDLSETQQWIRKIEDAGVDFITIHGRTRSQRSTTPPDYEAIKILKAQARVPIVANGDVYATADVEKIVKMTDVDGVMAARGILENPTLFAGHDTTPVECIHRFVDLAAKCPIPYRLVQHHIGEMTAHRKDIAKRDRRALMNCEDLIDLIDHIETKWGPTDSSAVVRP